MIKCEKAPRVDEIPEKGGQFMRNQQNGLIYMQSDNKTNIPVLHGPRQKKKRKHTGKDDPAKNIQAKENSLWRLQKKLTLKT